VGELGGMKSVVWVVRGEWSFCQEELKTSSIMMDSLCSVKNNLCLLLVEKDSLY